MSEKINLTQKIKEQLPAEVVRFMYLAGEAARNRHENLYLVGGVVRDLFLEQPNLDLDLVVDGDATELAKQLAQLSQSKVVIHPQFNTAKIEWNSWSVDIATSRSETYVKPGALPTVKPGSIENDLFRRDFTINAMAIYLTPSRYGELLDPYRGLGDLEQRLVRILHENSFIDDATRIWRGLRYEQRFDFQFETNTLRLLKRAIPMLDTISGDRIRHELERTLEEKFPEKVLLRAGELSVLAKLNPSLKGNSWLAEKFHRAREISPESPSVPLYLALLTYRLNAEETERFTSYLRFSKKVSQIIYDTGDIKDKIKELADIGILPSRIYHLLQGCSPLAITANLITTDSGSAHHNIQLYLDKLHHIKPALTGNDLKRLGIPSGPRIKEVLELLHDARLDGKVKSKKDEEEMARRVGLLKT